MLILDECTNIKIAFNDCLKILLIYIVKDSSIIKNDKVESEFFGKKSKSWTEKEHKNLDLNFNEAGEGSGTNNDQLK